MNEQTQESPHAESPRERSCHACGGALNVRFPRVIDPGSGEPFRIEACTSCGLGHTRPAPDAIEKYYGAYYHRARHSFTATFATRRRLRILQRHARRPGTLLDYGCGDGDFLLSASRAGWECIGTEMGQAASIARSEGLRVVLSLLELPPGESFAAATFWHSLEHLQDPANALRGLRRRMEPGALLIVAVPDARGWQARVFGNRWFHLDVPRHLFHFSKRSLGVLLERAGFRVEDWYHQELEYDVFGWIQSGLNIALGEPNVLYGALTGKTSKPPPLSLAVSYVGAAATASTAVAATALSTWSGRGGTLIAIARPS